MITDPLAEIAKLIAAVGDCYQRGRRYRDIAALCEERYLGRTLEIGAQVRRAARGGRLDVVATVEALRELVAGCESAIASVCESDVYRRAAASWEAGRKSEVAEAAALIFATVESYPQCPLLYYPVVIGARRGSGEHFVPPPVCADAIAEVGRNGIEAAPTPPELGADELIRAVVLSDDPDVVESPVTLSIDPKEIDAPICRVVPAGDVLIYASRLRVAFRVRFAEAVTDEWWALKPDAYRHYVAAVKAELEARGLPLENVPVRK